MSWRRVETFFGTPWFLVVVLAVAAFDCFKPESVFQNPLINIAVDSAIHTSLATIIWWIVATRLVSDMPEDIGMTRKEEITVVYLMSAAVDADHFIAAGALDMWAATHLPSRQGLIFHNPFTMVMLAALAHIYGRRPRLAAIIVIAMGSHLLRDATRTGLLCYPIGVTPAVPYVCFIAFVCMLPASVEKYLRRSFALKSIPLTLNDTEGLSV